VVLSVVGSNATITGCLPSENAYGVVTFSGCVVTTVGNTNQTIYLAATDSELPGLTFTSPSPVTISTAADYLVFTNPTPTAGQSGAALSSFSVEVYSNNAYNSHWSGTIAISSSGGDLTNCPAITTSNGKATFSSCDFAGAFYTNPISGAGLATPYTLTATATSSTPTSPATSPTIAVTGPGSPYELEFTTQPSGVANATASTPFTTQPTVQIEDSFGNVVTNSTLPVTLTISSGSLTCASHNPLNASGGSASFSGCAGSAYGTGLTLSASSPGLVTATSASFNITEPATQLIFTTEPVAGVSGTAFTTMPVLKFEDANGNVVTSENESVTLTPSGGTLSLCTGLTPNGGVVTVGTCTFAGIVNQGYTLTATAGSGANELIATSGLFFPTAAGPASQLVFTTAPVAGAAGSVLATQPVVSIEDSGGNVTNSNATISLGTNAGVLAGCSNLTAVQGVVDVANCSFGGTFGSYTLTASSPPLTVASAPLILSQPGPASPANSTLVASPASVSANGTSTSTATATLEDSYGNPIAGKTITLGAASGSSVISTVSGTTNVSGQATFTIVDASAQVVTYSGEDVSDGIAINQTATVTFYGSPSQIVLSGCASTTPLVSGSSCQATATIEDANGSIVTGYNGAVAFNQIAGTGSVTGLTGTTSFTNGVANVTITAKLAGTVSIDAVGDSITSNTVAFSITYGNASKIVLSGCSSSIASGSSCQATATLEDANGNTVSSFDGPVAFNQTGGTGSVNGLTGNTSFTNGVAGVILTGNKAGSISIDAVGDAFTSNTLSFNVTSGPASQVVLSGCSSNITSGSTCTATATLEDANGNTVTSYNGAVAFNQTTGTGSVTGLTGTTTFINGVANVTLTGNKAGTVTIDAVGDSITSNAVTFSVNVGAVSASASTVTASPASVVANGSSFSTVTVTLEDGNGNVVAGKTVTLSQGAGNSSTLPLTSTTNPSGQATFTATDLNAQTVIYTAKDTSDNITVNQTASVTFVPGTPSKVALAGCSSTIASGSTCTATATLEDVNGNTIATYNGAVAFSQTGGTGTVTGLTGTTSFTNGVANVIVTGNKAGTISIDAIGDSITSNTVSFSVSFGSASKIVLSGCSSNIASGSTCTATATLEDANSNTITTYGGTVAFNQTTGTGSVTGLTGTTTFTNGVASVTLTGNKAGTVTIDAVGDAITSNAVSFSVTVGTPTKVVLSGCSSNIASGSTCIATATLEDANSNTITTYGGTVAFNQTTGTGSVTGLTGTTTFTNGVASVTLTGNKVGTVTIDAVGDAFTSGTSTFSVTVGSANAYSSSTSASDTSVVANGTTTATITATLLDAAGNPISGKAISLAAGSGSSVIATVLGTTNTAGQATFTVKDATAQAVAYTATDTSDGVTIAQKAPVNFFTPVVNAASSTVSVSDSTVDDNDTTATITVTLLDPYGNPVTGKTVSLSQTGSSTITTGTDPTNALGQATFTVKSLSAQGVTYTAKDTTDNVTIAQTTAVSFTNGATSNTANTDASTASASDTSVVANGTTTATITITLESTSGRVVTGKTVTLSQGTGTSTIVTGTDPTNSAGQATFTVKSSSAQPVTYTATDTTDGVAIAQTVGVDFYATASANAAASTVTSAPTSVIANGSTTSTITVTLLDAFGNVVPGKTVTLNQGAGGSSITTVTGVTNASGQATFTVTDATAQAVTYTATDSSDALAITQSTSVNFHD
jgi:adhesin/invasin